jgi:hypothetical protein
MCSNPPDELPKDDLTKSQERTLAEEKLGRLYGPGSNKRMSPMRASLLFDEARESDAGMLAAYGGLALVNVIAEHKTLMQQIANIKAAFDSVRSQCCACPSGPPEHVPECPVTILDNVINPPKKD